MADPCCPTPEATIAHLRTLLAAAEQRLREVEGERDEAVKMAAADVSGSIEIGRLRSDLAALRERIRAVVEKWSTSTVSAAALPWAEIVFAELRALSPSTAEPASGAGAGNPGGGRG